MRTEATGYGCVYFANEMLATRAESLQAKTCVVSGSGNVALYTAKKALELGAKVLTLSDSSGFIHDADGITEEKLAWTMDLKTERHGRIQEYAEHFDAAYHAGQRPWGVPCDIAFPAATQNELAASDADLLIANGVQVVSEGANMPTTPDAVERLQAAGVLYAPGKAANAGGVAVSGLEQSQNAQRLQWTADEVDARLQTIMAGIHTQCVTHGEVDGELDYVRGANVAGFLKVAEAMLAHGTL